MTVCQGSLIPFDSICLSAGGRALLRAPRREVLCRRAVHHALLSVEDNQQGGKDISQGVD